MVNPRTLQDAFEQALFLWLAGGSAKVRMIGFGVAALEAGEDGDAVVALAGADPDTRTLELVTMFEAAGRSLGYDVPDVEARKVWRARAASRLEARNAGLIEARSADARFRDALLLIHANMQRRVSGSVFVVLLGRWFAGTIDDYAAWLDALGAAAAPDPIATEVADLLRRTAYGALEPNALDAVKALRRASDEALEGWSS